MSIDASLAAPDGSTHEAPVITVATDDGGRISDARGTWKGVITAPATVHELVHPDDHDVLDHMLGWLGNGGTVDHGLAVQVRGPYGWDDAIVVATTDGAGHVFTFTPALPDSTSGVIDRIGKGRELPALLDEALAAFADLDVVLWATAHFDHVDGRYTSVVATTGMDMFRRSIEAATAGDAACPWDRDDDGTDIDVILGVAEFSDGVHIAGRHAALNACRVVSVPGHGDVDVARVTLWAEHAGELESPVVAAMLDNVVRSLTLCFEHDRLKKDLRDATRRDGLTATLNRQAFLAELAAAGARRQCAVACIDIDCFRAVNQWKGHAAGDAVLTQVARRLGVAMRPGDVLARTSGDEFAVVLADIKTDEAAAAIAQRLADIFETPFVIGGVEQAISATIGLATAAPERIGVALFDAATRTMLETKASAPGTWSIG